MPKRSVFVLIAMLGLTACASSSGSRASTHQDVITAEEIERTMVSDLYELVQRLRPRWLDLRSPQSFESRTEIVVFEGQAYRGGVEVLREFAKEAAVRLIYLDGPTATVRLPGLTTRNVEGAIVINPTN